MKKFITSISAVTLLGLFTLVPNPVFGQATSTTTTVTSSGTVSEFSPDAIAVKVDTSPTPVRYTFSRTTTYVDENGNPVSVETVRSGAPVTVYYEKIGGNFVADKVVVRKSVTTTDAVIPPPAPITSTTTTSSTVSPNPGPPSVNGMVTEADSDDIAIRIDPATKPMHYQAHDSTAYVDENGNPVSRKILTRGTPVTIFYEQHGDDMVATRVVVGNSAVSERQSTTTTTRETTMPAQ